VPQQRYCSKNFQPVESVADLMLPRNRWYNDPASGSESDYRGGVKIGPGPK